MQKLYGQSLRRESGLVKNLRRSLPPPFRQWQRGMDHFFGETVDFVEDFLEAARPKLAGGMSTFVRDSSALFVHPTRISITRLDADMAGFDPEHYSLSIINKPIKKGCVDSPLPAEDRSGRRTLKFDYGAPIRIRWTAPANHRLLDWVGLYLVADNPSREATRIASQGRWVATNLDQYDSITADRGILLSDVPVKGTFLNDNSGGYLGGEMEFSGDKLWWTTGVFEFRYHHNGKHNVMAISLPFEVKIPKFDEDNVDLDSNGQIHGAVEEALLPIVRNCFDLDPEIAPNNINEPFGSLVERDGKYARRVVYAIHQMWVIIV